MSTLAVSHFNDAVEEMLAHLKTFLPADSTLALVEAAERPVGVGAFSGNVERGPLAVLGMRGGRVEARVRFDVVAPTPADVAAAVRDLQKAVLDARLDSQKLESQKRWMRDFLVLEPAGGAPADPFGGSAWRESVEYRALYEYHYEDPEDAGGLIVSIRVDLHGEHHEQMDVTRDLTRWSAAEAPPLRIRGPRAIGTLTALVLDRGFPASGLVTVACTHEGAVPAAPVGDLAAFANAVAGGSRNERVVLGVAAFLAAFADADTHVPLAGADGTLVEHGVWTLLGNDKDSQAALAQARLADAGQRLEVAYSDPNLQSDEPPRFSGSNTSVVYLRAGRGPSA